MSDALLCEVAGKQKQASTLTPAKQRSWKKRAAPGVDVQDGLWKICRCLNSRIQKLWLDKDGCVLSCLQAHLVYSGRISDDLVAGRADLQAEAILPGKIVEQRGIHFLPGAAQLGPLMKLSGGHNVSENSQACPVTMQSMHAICVASCCHRTEQYD